MAYETDEARDAARRRLQARMERRGAHQATAPGPGARRRAQPEPGRQPAARPAPGVTRTLPPVPPIALVAAGVMLAGALVVIAITQCARIVPAGTEQPAASGDKQVPVIVLDNGNEAQRKLVELVGEDEAKKLLLAATSDLDALWIAAHPDAYAFDGIERQSKIVKLAADEPAAVPYVRSFPSRYPTTKPDDGAEAMSGESPSDSVPDTQVLHLYQWDRRWGYTTYGSTAFGLTGSGPTSMAMVANALADEKTTPYDMAKLADELGYTDQADGTDADFFTEAAEQLGLSCTQLYPTGDSVTEALATGQVVIANLGPGQFTSSGHYFVLAGLDNWNVIVNDPYSVERSSQTWDPETIADESITLFAYSAIPK